MQNTISKRLVAKTQDTGRGLALENLKGIRERTRFRKAQRAKMGGWSFYQLRRMIEDKAALAGVELVIVDPRNTSRTCAACGHISRVPLRGLWTRRPCRPERGPEYPFQGQGPCQWAKGCYPS